MNKEHHPTPPKEQMPDWLIIDLPLIDGLTESVREEEAAIARLIEADAAGDTETVHKLILHINHLRQSFLRA